MSIFSKIKGAKKAADKHKQAKSTEIPVEIKDTPVPYRHVPTHAAVDALTGAPASWREEDRAAIKHQHKRRTTPGPISATMARYLGPQWAVPDPLLLDWIPDDHTMGLDTISRVLLRVTVRHGNQISRSSSSSQLIELPPVSKFQQHGQHGLHGQHLSPMDNAPRTTARKLGEAPLFDAPPERVFAVTTPATAPSPVNAKKRSWGFMKRNSGGTAIAAH
ncbi:MAG: hypothetical protein Q9172_004688 [Xanthocarpia lactea]